MKKWHAKAMSNFIKFCIVGFVFFNYVYQSSAAGHPLTSDEAKSLLYIALAGFLILAPVDASIFIKNWKSVTETKPEPKKEEDDHASSDPYNS